jgi:hypothetical protein
LHPEKNIYARLSAGSSCSQNSSPEKASRQLISRGLPLPHPRVSASRAGWHASPSCSTDAGSSTSSAFVASLSTLLRLTRLLPPLLSIGNKQAAAW